MKANTVGNANVITWDGLVAPCCFDNDAMHQLGNLKTQPFRETWKNIDICANCSEGLSVWED